MPLLSDAAPQLARLLKRSAILSQPRFSVSEIRIETVMVEMRDGVKLATDVYLPPELPAPVVAVRTPYARAMETYVGPFVSLARRGYVVVSQDVRATGDSEPEVWDHYMYEPEDGYDTVEWISAQEWFGGFLGSAGGSYVGQTQWHMAMHPAMSTIVPEVSGLGVAVNTAHWHLMVDGYARSIGKGEGQTPVPFSEMEALTAAETLASGYFNEPLHQPLPESLLTRYPELQGMEPAKSKRWLWEHYCALSCAERAGFVREVTGKDRVTILEIEQLPAIFGHQVSHDRHTLPHPRMEELVASMHAPVLLRTGWYDWGVNDAIETWDLLMRAAPEPMRSRCRLFLAPAAHNMPGYHEGMAEHPELHHAYSFVTNLDMQLAWYEAVRNDALDGWPTVIYYLMGANEWRAAEAWPPPDAHEVSLYLGADGALGTQPPTGESEPDTYVYDPEDPPPTVGGSIVSWVYPPGSVDVSGVQQRPDVLTYTTEVLTEDLDVAGPLRLTLFVSSSAVDTDFVGRLSDVFPDGRAIQLQNGILRARYRNLDGEPELLEPGRVYELEVDMWATANRFAKGHRLRLDVCSADFPRWDRNTNLGGQPGAPFPATQTIFHDADHPSHLTISLINDD